MSAPALADDRRYFHDSPGSDVRLRRCVTCGEPSDQGLCNRCAYAPTRRKWEPEDAPEPRRRAKWWRKVRNGTWNCTCTQCVEARAERKARSWRPPHAGNPHHRRAEP